MKSKIVLLPLALVVLLSSCDAQLLGPGPASSPVGPAVAPSPYVSADGNTTVNGFVAPFDYNNYLPCLTGYGTDTNNFYDEWDGFNLTVDNSAYAAAKAAVSSWFASGQTPNGPVTQCTPQAPNLTLSTDVNGYCNGFQPWLQNWAMLLSTNISCVYIDTANCINYSVNETVTLAAIVSQSEIIQPLTMPAPFMVNMTKLLDYTHSRMPVTQGLYNTKNLAGCQQPPSTGRKLLAF